MFILILNEPLPSDTNEGYHAIFGNSAAVVLTKENPFNLNGKIPGDAFSSIVHILNHSYYNLCVITIF